ncbi:MAG: TipAS antibiotic-recognition domain-containing protein, partial [Eggerthellaceae bacterium]|nr:TipAS antibiotic-recognition domain-containing protein [Eggerthellaceae bacterium]
PKRGPSHAASRRTSRSISTPAPMRSSRDWALCTARAGSLPATSTRWQAKASWGATPVWAEYEKRSSGRTAKEERNMGEELMGLFAPFAKMAAEDTDPTAPEAQAAARRVQAFITEHFYPCTDEIFAQLGRTYGAGGEFTHNINAVAGDGAAEFAAKVIAALQGSAPKR